jgi:hypothetical protein
VSSGEPFIVEGPGDVAVSVIAYNPDEPKLPESMITCKIYTLAAPPEPEPEPEPELEPSEPEKPKTGIYYGNNTDTSGLLIANSAIRAEKRKKKKEEQEAAAVASKQAEKQARADESKRLMQAAKKPARDKLEVRLGSAARAQQPQLKPLSREGSGSKPGSRDGARPRSSSRGKSR